MKPIATRIIVAAVASFPFVLWYGHRNQFATLVQQSGPLQATRLYTGADGQTHAEAVPVKLSPLAGAPATIEQSEPVAVTRSYLVRAAPGTVETWRNPSARRYMIVISGRAELGIADGQTVIVEPGKICLAEDLTGQGHTFRVLGSNEWVALFVDLAK
jgi:hypothetical protein